MKNFNIGEFQIWDMKVHQKNKIITDYKLFHASYPSQEKYVDYGNSEFYLGSFKDFKWNGEDIKILDYKSYLNTKEILEIERRFLKVRKLVFNFKNAKEDLIRITNTTTILNGSGYYVSEKLKKAILEEGYTGMSFKEIDENKKIEVIY